MKLKIKLLDEKCKPYRAFATDSGLDLRARLDDSITIKPHDYVTIPVGVAVELPEGYEGQIRPRSGLARKGIIAAYGTIDNGYRGEIKVVLYNHNNHEYRIEPYERIAQLVIAPIHIPEIEYVDELSESKRADKGFGSTGTK